MRNVTVIVCSVLVAGLVWAQPSTSAQQLRIDQQQQAKPKTKKDTRAAKKPVKPAVGADVFGHEKVWQFHLTLPAAEYAAMQPDTTMLPGFAGGPPTPPKVESTVGKPPREVHRGAFFEFPWAVASLTFEDRTIEKVGLRYKGNATYGMSSRNLKRSLKVDIDQHDDKARFHGLKSLTLSSGVFDSSKCRESLTYSIYRAAGVPAPRTAFAEMTLSVNGKYAQEYVGLYTLIESVDKNFLKLHFENNEGLLMKPERIPGLVYLGDDWTRYQETYLPKREATQDEIQRVMNFTQLVSESSDDQFNHEIASYLDMHAFLKFMAVTAIVANLDSFHSGHNYCLYLHPDTQKFHFIPWDVDLALGGFPMLGAPEQMDLSLIKPYAGQSKLSERLLANEQYAETYQQILRELVPLCFAKESLLDEIATIETVIGPLLEKELTAVVARKENSGGPSGKTGPFGHPAADLKTFIAKRTESIASQLAGKSKGFTPTNFGPPGGGPPKGGPGGRQPNADQRHRQITEMLGPSFLIFRDGVRQDLKLSDQQNKMLEERLSLTVHDAMQFFQRLGVKESSEREREHRAYVENAQANQMSFLKETLTEEQMSRLRQVMLQREGLFALGNTEVVKQLALTDQQRQQFNEVMEEMQRHTEQLSQKIHNGGRPEEIGPKIMQFRQTQLDRIEALLTDSQMEQWKQKLGKPLNLDE